MKLEIALFCLPVSQVSADDQLVDVEDGGMAVVEDQVMPQTFGSDKEGLGLEDGEELVVEVVNVSELEKKVRKKLE